MKEIEDTNNGEFALVYRWLDDDDSIHVRLLILITEVPASITATQVKNVVSLMSKSILDGTSSFMEHDGYIEVDWGKGFKLVPRLEWNTKLKADVALLKKRAVMTNIEINGVRIARIDNSGIRVMMSDDTCDLCRLIPYSDLLDDLKGEKRVTLRLPLELHSLLVKEAYAQVCISLNSFCIKKLAEAVEFDESKLEEFEAQRRKPGRPKKVQDGE